MSCLQYEPVSTTISCTTIRVLSSINSRVVVVVRVLQKYLVASALFFTRRESVGTISVMTVPLFFTCRFLFFTLTTIWRFVQLRKPQYYSTWSLAPTWHSSSFSRLLFIRIDRQSLVRPVGSKDSLLFATIFFILRPVWSLLLCNSTTRSLPLEAP